MKINTLRGRLRPGRPFGPEAVTGAPFAPKAWLGRLGLTLGPSLLEAAAAAPPFAPQAEAPLVAGA